jgi:hypothetical protein
VKSPRKSCRIDRTVQLIKKRPGPDLVLDTEETDENGQWQINSVPSPDGRFVAKVLKEKWVNDHGMKVVCQAGVSRLLVR